MESAAWAAAAWYWHRKKTYSELAKAIVIVLAALIAIGEIIQISKQFTSEPPKTSVSNPNPFDSAFNGPYTSPQSQTTDSAAASAASAVADAEKQAEALFHQKRYKEARPLFEQACDGTDRNGFKYAGIDGEIKACNYLGYLYAKGIGGAQNTKKARDAYQKACDQGTMSSCASLGSLYQDAEDGVNARKYFQKACDGGVAEGCDLLRGVK
jgi:TPR repeat protein